ncbi:LytR/AlgR family response regulator transcription factor [Holdemania massiliensis]|uniref:LytR/AlgR family response regulator transcription factor n=1 Tax=Holdemania massiliensis TaxID=1468449 RepID=UPI001F067F0F|nr:LytTR family DNA-binding domain-containing protein [Holdemania massiliensis]MCH1942402.1 LytTR family DNA-binding domain-containing protein [Holdemania massiliensis]
MKCAILDDQQECRSEICESLRRYAKHRMPAETLRLDEYASGETFLKTFRKESYDLLFLDQYMNGLSGLATAQEIRRQDPLVPLVFVTTSRDHAVDSYGVRACGYLVKPYTQEAFDRMLDNVGMEKIRRAQCLCLEQDKLLLREILWCDVSGHYCQIHTDDGRLFRYRMPFAQLLDQLSAYPQFLMCYKGCLVNMQRVDVMDVLDFVMDTGDRIPFSKRERRKIEAQYHAYLFDQARREVLL